jgi:hypothetical protein
MSAGMLTFSFTLHSCFVGNIGRIVLKCPSLSFSTTSSLNFCTLIRWIRLLWLDVSPKGHQRGAGAVPGAVVLDILLCHNPREIGWFGLSNRTVQFGCSWELAIVLALISVSSLATLFCFSAISSGPFPCYASLRHRSKSRSSALFDLDCPLIHQQKIRLWAPTARAADQRLLLPSGKPNGPI